jgi:hypothetical protein
VRPKPKPDPKEPTKPAPPTPPKPVPPKEPSDVDPDYGFRINKDFHIISLLGEGRYIDWLDSQYLVVKVQNGKPSQKWYFDQASKTIK